jgi:hypothetical protein
MNKNPDDDRDKELKQSQQCALSEAQELTGKLLEHR